MKNKFVINITAIALTLVISSIAFTSCNKGFEEVPSAATATGQNMAERLNADPNYSIFRDAMVKYGLMTRLSNPGSTNTVLALDNATMTFVLGTFSLHRQVLMLYQQGSQQLLRQYLHIT